MMHPPYSIISLPCPGFLLRGVRPYTEAVQYTLPDKLTVNATLYPRYTFRYYYYSIYMMGASSIYMPSV